MRQVSVSVGEIRRLFRRIWIFSGSCCVKVCPGIGWFAFDLFGCRGCFGYIYNVDDKDDNYYPAPEFEGDPTAEYIEANVDFDTQISQENSDPDTFYTYFCLCNASDHKIYFTLTFCPTKNDEFIDHMNGLVDPGKKYTNRFVTSNWSMDVPGLITTFSPLITEMEVYYDVDDKYGPVRFPSGIEEKYSDFTQRFKTRQICDPGQWIYEEFTPRRARWTYILTNEDYERAKMMSGK